MNKQDSENKQTDIAEKAINIKQKESDGREINHQQQDRREIHQPRDNA